MKKFLSVLLAAALLLTVVSFAGAEAAELPEAFAHITFDGADEGYKAVTNGDADLPDGANKSIIPAEGAEFLYGAGAVGNALYIDGTYGLDLGLQPTNTDVWTVSFWVNADRLSDYGPTLQIGYNMGRAADAGNNVAWMNVTQTNWTPKYFPTIWSRNEGFDSADGVDCWPWMAPFQDDGAMIGKREWAMFTIVATGEEQNLPSGAKGVGAKLYVNGELRYDSQENYVNGTYFNMTWDASLAPAIMQPGDNTFESLFGINYWDTIYKGYVDDLYVFDTALTAEQVAALFAAGDATVDSPKGGPAADAAAAEPEPVPAAVEVVINGTQVGEADFSTAFWGAHSDIWGVAAGESKTVKLVNYHAAEASNWNTPNVVLQTTPTGHAADQAEGYAEYAVVRTDNYGWGAGYDGIAQLECDWNWDTFVADTNGAEFTVTVVNNGETADVLYKVVTPAGVEHFQNYKGIAVTGDVYFCFVCDGNCMDILSIE